MDTPLSSLPLHSQDVCMGVLIDTCLSDFLRVPRWPCGGWSAFYSPPGMALSYNFGWEIIVKKLLCVHSQTNRFVRHIWSDNVFFFSPYKRLPVNTNKTFWRRHRDPLARWITPRHEGDETFVLFHLLFSFSPHASSCRRLNIKGKLLLIREINDSHMVWIELFFPYGAIYTSDTRQLKHPFPYFEKWTIKRCNIF